MGPWPRFYQVTIISDGHSGGVAHTDRQISLKARGQRENGSGRVDEHPSPILAAEKALVGLSLQSSSGGCVVCAEDAPDLVVHPGDELV